jgi:hypothetical protein
MPYCNRLRIQCGNVGSIVSGVVTVHHHLEVGFFSEGPWHIGRDCFRDISIEFGPVKGWKRIQVDIRVCQVKDKSGVMFKSEVAHHIEFPANQLIPYCHIPFGIINVREAHYNYDHFFMTPMDTSLVISFIREAVCILSYRVWPAMIWLASFLFSIEMGGLIQSPYVPFRTAHI